MKSYKITLSFFCLILSCATASKFPYTTTSTKVDRSQYEGVSSKYMIATQGFAASKAAKNAFNQGGNIIDAAVAASFAISVERPQSTGLGGGGFLIYHEAKTGKNYAVDFRERAPIKAIQKMYLDQKGEVIDGLSTDGILSAGTPGLVAGLTEVHKKFGKLKLAQIMEPAIQLAEEGIVVYPYLAEALEDERDNLAKFEASKKIFLKENGETYKIGEKIIQKDLAITLRKIAKEGKSGFYSGEVAKAIILENQARKGLITKQDLDSYKVKWRKPVIGKYKKFSVVSFPPPSSGGTHVIEILNLLENDDLKSLGFQSSKALHLEAQAMQQVFADRSKFMGDPDFFKEIPLQGLLSQRYADKMRSKFDNLKVRTADQVSAGNAPEYESSETTHFTIMDIEGNVVVSTQTINGWFGSKVVVPGTGVLLNNEMDDFSAKPGASNIYGAVGGTPNAIQSRKTPLSSMSPTIIFNGMAPVLALGAPGGTRIITCVAQTALNYLEFGLPLYEAISATRFHHQWKPDQLELEEPGPSKATVSELEKMGYKIKLGKIGCRVNAVAREGQTLRGAADPRDIGSAVGE